MASAAEPVNWKRNLFVAWVGCFLTGAAFSLVMPFLPLYVETLGVTGHQALNMWSGLLFSITFLFSAIAAPFWGALADRRGRKLMPVSYTHLDVYKRQDGNRVKNEIKF